MSEKTEVCYRRRFQLFSRLNQTGQLTKCRLFTQVNTEKLAVFRPFRRRHSSGGQSVAE